MCRSTASWLDSAKSWIHPESRIDIASEWSFQMLIGAPIARLATVITIGSPRPEALKQRLGHEQQPLAGRWRCRCGRRRAEAPMQADMAPNSDSTMRYSHGRELAGADQVGERLDDVRLRRDRVRRDHLRPAEGDGAGHRLRALDLLSIGRPPHRSRSTCSWAASAARGVAGRRPRRGSGAGSRPAPRPRDDLAGEGGEGAEQGGVGQRAAQVLPGDLGGGHGDDVLGRSRSHEVLEPELRRAVREVLTSTYAVGPQPREDGSPGAAASGPARSPRPGR